MKKLMQKLKSKRGIGITCILSLIVTNLYSQEVFTDVGSETPIYGEMQAAIDVDASGNIYVGSDYGKVFMSSDKGLTFTEITSNLHYKYDYTVDAVYSIPVCVGNDVYVFQKDAGHGIYAYDKTNNSWERKNTGLGSDSTNIVAMFGLSNSNLIIYTAPDGEPYKTYVSTNKAESWVQVFDREFESIWIKNSDTAFVYVTGLGAYISKDNGATWLQDGVDNYIPSIFNNYMQTSTGVWYAVDRNTLSLDNIYKFNENTKQWDNVTTNLGDHYKYFFITTGDTAYAITASDNKLVYSIGDFTTWSLVDGIVPNALNGIHYDEVNGYMYAQTSTTLYRTIDSISTSTLPKPTNIKNIKELFDMLVYMKSSTLYFTIESPSIISLSLYNVSGEKVYMNEKFCGAGENSFDINNELSTGVYFYTLIVGKEPYNGKLIIK